MINFFKKLFSPKIDLVNISNSEYTLMKNLIESGVDNNVYDQKFIEDEKNFDTIVKDYVTGHALRDVYGRLTFALSCSFNGESIGFITLALDEKKNEVELWHFSILENYRNLGLGNKYLTILFKLIEREIPNAKFFARVNDNAKSMKKLLLKRGFIENGQNKHDYKFFYK